MSLQFSKYPSIENHYRNKYIEQLAMHGYANIPYIAHEKIHGANFSFWANGLELRVASRGSFVDGTFYGCQPVIDRYKDAILHLSITEFPGAVVAVYGELYGPGIQAGIYYSERKDFRAFDIKVDGTFIAPLKAKILFAKYDIPEAPFIAIYENVYEALEATNIFDSKVRYLDKTLHGLTKFLEYKEGANEAEGMIIQPLEQILYTGNGSRVMIKSKHPKFTEKNKKRNQDSKTYTPNPFIEIVEQYVNKNRMNAVLSKMGEITHKDFGKVIGLMSKDVIEDMIRDEDIPADYKKQEEYKLVGKGVTTVVAKFLKENLLRDL